MRSTLNRYGLVGAIAFVAACAATGGTSVFDSDAGDQGAGGNDAGAPSSSSVSTSGGVPSDNGVGVSVGSGTADTGCSSGKTEDKDKDGWTVANGDCNDCDPNVNPGAIEVIATMSPGADGGVPVPVDEDCDGKVDNIPLPCDDNLKLADNDPMNAAKAVDLCQTTTDAKHWGVISAKWVLPDGSAAPQSTAYAVGHGLLTQFGPNVHVQSGTSMLGLSSGAAREPNTADYQSPKGYSKGYTCNPPPGFPKESPACKGVTTGTPRDAAALELNIRVPSNAHGFSFDFNFFTYEWPSWVCSKYNDFFVSLLSPTPTGQPGFDNISFDSQGNPVSVNNAFVEVCGCYGGPPCSAGGKQFACKLGNAGLSGTGFDNGFNSASTSWLVTKSPATPGQQITLRWAVYESGDGNLDTTTLIDHWQWIADSGTTVGTGQVPTPK